MLKPKRNKHRIKLVLLLLLAPAIAMAAGWQDLWLNRNQRGSHLLDQGKNAEAAATFESNQWKGIAYYRDKQYAKAYNEFKKDKSALGYYNQGNALAYMQKYQEAINAYQEALKQDKNYPDAKHNIEVLQKLLKDQQQQKQSQNKNQDKSQDKDKQPQPKQQAGNQEKNPGNNSQNQQKNSGQQQNNQNPKDANKANNASQHNQGQDGKDQENKPENPQAIAGTSTKSPEQQKIEQKIKAILSKVPDDPGGLLRNKFLRDYQAQQQEGNNE